MVVAVLKPLLSMYVTTSAYFCVAVRSTRQLFLASRCIGACENPGSIEIITVGIETISRLNRLIPTTTYQLLRQASVQADEISTMTNPISGRDHRPAPSY